MKQILTTRLKSIQQKTVRMGIVMAFVVVGAALSWFEPQGVLQIREVVWDNFVRWKPRVYDPAIKVRIVDIDEKSLKAQGQWPWPRARIARIIDALAAYGARAVAFDVLFVEPDRTTLSDVFEALKKDIPGYEPPLSATALAAQPDNDALLAAAMEKMPVVLGLSIEYLPTAVGARPLKNLPRVKFERRKDRSLLFGYTGSISALPLLQHAAATNAAIELPAGKGGVTRMAPMFYKVNKRTVLSLSAALVHAAIGGGITAHTMRPGVRAVSIGQYVIPTNNLGQMRLYDSGRQAARYYSATDVLTNSLPADALKNAIVIVGTGAEGLRDLRLTPLSNWVPGMETHAQFVEQMLSGTFLTRPHWGSKAEGLATLASGLLLFTAIYYGWARAPSWAIAVAAAGLFIVIAWTAFSEIQILLDPFFPAVALLIAAMVNRFLLVLDLRRERSAVRSAFTRYLAPAVVEQLAENPDRLTLGGERREMTFLFCDIRGFTGISEFFENDPEGLTQLINQFLTPMTNAIMARHGTIDKYMGDCIMAFWNAPLEDSRHAVHACQSALAMQHTLTELNERLSMAARESGANPFEIRVGVGLNTGNCVVGNMGSEQRFDYSVLGDAVNLASRLEGQSNTYGVGVLIGEDTKAGAPEFAALEVDLIAVKGRAAAVRVYALLGDIEVRDSGTFQELAKLQATMLSAYRNRKWGDARDFAQKCRALSPGEWRLDTLYDLYEDRILAHETTAPPEDWNGVYIADTK